MACGHMISWCWLPGSRAPWSLSSQPLISPLRGGERAEAPPALRRRCFFSYCCDSALLPGCICSGSGLLTAAPRLVPGAIVRLGGNGSASEFSCKLRTATKALQFPTIWLAMLWQQKTWWWVFLLILENIATQIIIATTVYCMFPMWWPFDIYFHLTFAATVKNLPAMQDTWVWSLGREDPLEKGMTIHSSILAWRIPMDRGAWQSTVHGVTKSWTQLSD